MKNEMLGIRCGLLSERHRLWGECFMTDIDYIVTTLPGIEYFDRKAVAMIEYKMGLHKHDLSTASISATEDVANRASLPFFIVQYDPSDWEVLVRPRNPEARAFVERNTYMSEQEYVAFLHRLRSQVAPDRLLAKLSRDSQKSDDPIQPEKPAKNDNTEKNADCGRNAPVAT